MTARPLTLALSAALLTLSGCASQQTGSDPLAASNQRMNTLETRQLAESSSTLARLGELGKKVDLLGADLGRQRAAAAEQAGAGAAARQALAERLAQVEQQQQSAAAQQAKQLADLNAALTALRDQAGESRRQLDHLAARLDFVNAEQGQALQAETTELEARLDDAEEQLEAMASRLQDGQARTEAVEAALPGVAETTGGNGRRIDALAARLDELNAANGARQTALAEKIDGATQRLDTLAHQSRAALEQAGAANAMLPALREQTAAAGVRLNDYDARLAALDKRLEEVARMAQDAYDATGLGQRKIFGKVIESITLTEDRTLFPINSPDLGEQDKAKLDALALRLKALGTNYHLQIQGHTEGFGADDYNYELGKARAEVVKNYLKEKGGIPLLRMSVMSYGSLEAAGQVGKSNRRVVVQVLQ